jgi:cobalt-zinc-cadmium efflux system protein
VNFVTDQHKHPDQHKHADQHAHADQHEHGAHRDPAAAVSKRRERRLLIAVALNSVIVVVQVVFGFIAHSLGLLADASHNLTDVAALGASIVAIRLARRRANAQRSFGYHRATILAAQANAASILAITMFIVYEGIKRILNPEPVEGGVVVVVAIIAAAANLLAVFAVKDSHAGHDHNMHSAMLHLVGDTAASVGVAVAGTVILFTGRFYWLDPAVSIGIGILIARYAWKLLRSTTDVLLESTPAGIDTAEVTRAIAEVRGVEQVHDLHVWSLSSEVHALSAHVVVLGHPSLEEAQLVGNEVKAAVRQRFAIGHATIELECEACEPIDNWCAPETPAINSYR